MKIYSSRTQSDLDTYKQYAGQNFWLKVDVSNSDEGAPYEYLNIIMFKDGYIYFREISEIYLRDNNLSDDDMPDAEMAGADEPVRAEIDYFCSGTSIVRPLDIFTNAEMEDLLGLELNDTQNMISIAEDAWEL